MEPYKSKSGKRSGVTAFEMGDDYIIVQFSHGDTYRYSYQSERRHWLIDTMKVLAIEQRGLSTFISRNQPVYE